VQNANVTTVHHVITSTRHVMTQEVTSFCNGKETWLLLMTSWSWIYHQQ